MAMAEARQAGTTKCAADPCAACSWRREGARKNTFDLLIDPKEVTKSRSKYGIQKERKSEPEWYTFAGSRFGGEGEGTDEGEL